MKSCITCGMPFVGNHADDVGLELPEGSVCKFDSGDGKVKSGKEIFDGGVNFFSTEVTDGDVELAERLTRKNMSSLAYWQARPLDELTGPKATDEEFQSAISKL